MILASLPHPSRGLEIVAWMADHLRKVIGPKTYVHDPFGQLLHYLYFHVHRTYNRLGRLYTQWRDGTLKEPRPTKPRTTKSKPPRFRLPGGLFWLGKRVDGIGGPQYTLNLALADPDFARFIAEVPRARRILNPIARAVGVVLPNAPPRKPRKPRPKKPRQAKPDFGGKYPHYNWRTYSPGKIPPAKKSQKA